MRLKDKYKAIELRKLGRTYKEIISEIPNLSKGTLSGWFKNLKLTRKQRSLIIKRATDAQVAGKLKGAWFNILKHKRRIHLISNEAAIQFKKIKNDPFFVAGLVLYWAEGSKTNRRFEFINSDPDIIRLMMAWLRKIFKIKEKEILIRIFIHRIYKKENCEKFWSKIVGVPASKFAKTIYKPTPHLIKKNPSYKGCCRIELRGSEMFWKFCAWRELFKKTMPL